MDIVPICLYYSSILKAIEDGYLLYWELSLNELKFILQIFLSSSTDWVRFCKMSCKLINKNQFELFQISYNTGLFSPELLTHLTTVICK